MDEHFLVSSVEVGATYAAGKKRVAAEQNVFFFAIITNATRGVSRRMNNDKFRIGNGNFFTVGNVVRQCRRLLHFYAE